LLQLKCGDILFRLDDEFEVFAAGDNNDWVAPNDNFAPYNRDRNWVQGLLDLNNISDNTNTVFLTDTLLASYVGAVLGSLNAIYAQLAPKKLSSHPSKNLTWLFHIQGLITAR
jgi:hypothetical protein